MPQGKLNMLAGPHQITAHLVKTRRAEGSLKARERRFSQVRAVSLRTDIPIALPACPHSRAFNRRPRERYWTQPDLAQSPTMRPASSSERMK